VNHVPGKGLLAGEQPLSPSDDPNWDQNPPLTSSYSTKDGKRIRLTGERTLLDDRRPLAGCIQLADHGPATHRVPRLASLAAPFSAISTYRWVPGPPGRRSTFCRLTLVRVN
jgi:hypothetical protein